MDKNVPLFTRPFRIALLFFAVCILVETGSFARKPEAVVLPKAPPQPIAQEVHVKRGASIEIPLKIYGTRSQTLDFLIRIPPQTGKLSAIKRIGQETGSVIYTPVKDLAVKRDKFSFAVRSSEGVSASVETVINIVDADPEFFAPAEVNFGRLLANEQATQTLEISNRGGGIAEGELEIDPPWKIDGSAYYRLNAGSTGSIKLIFAPRSVKIWSGQLRYGPGTNRTTALSGEAIPPFSVSPDRLILKQSAADKTVRSNELEITNNTASEQTILLSAHARASFPQKLSLQPLARELIRVEIPPPDAASFDCEMRIASSLCEFKLPVHADAIPAILHIKRASIDFGNVSFGGTARERFEIENRGGTTATVTLDVNAPYFLQQSSIILAAGEQKELLLGLRSANPGLYRTALSIRALSHEDLSIPVEARVVPAVVAAIPMAKQLSRTASQTSSSTHGTLSSRREENAPETQNGSPLQRGQIVQLSSNMAVIDWVEQTPGAARFKAEWRQLSLEAGKLKTEWKEITSFTTKFKDGQRRGTFTSLSPATFYAIRISVIEANGAAVVICDTQFTTLKKESRFNFSGFTTIRILIGVFLLSLGGALWQRFARRRLLP